MICNLVCDQVLVVDQFDLKCLRGGVLVLSNELFSKLPPHQRFRFGIGAQIVSSLTNDALVELVQVNVPNADFRFGLQTGAVFTLVSITTVLNCEVCCATYPRFSWNSANSFINSSYSLVRSMESPRFGAMVDNAGDYSFASDTHNVSSDLVDHSWVGRQAHHVRTLQIYELTTGNATRCK